MPQVRKKTKVVENGQVQETEANKVMEDGEVQVREVKMKQMIMLLRVLVNFLIHIKNTLGV